MFAFFRAGIHSVTIGQVMLLQGLKFDHMIRGLEVPVLKTYACIKVCMYKIPAGRWAVTLFPGVSASLCSTVPAPAMGPEKILGVLNQDSGMVLVTLGSSLLLTGSLTGATTPET